MNTEATEWLKYKSIVSNQYVRQLLIIDVCM